jgi:hypothetical protein
MMYDHIKQNSDGPKATCRYRKRSKSAQENASSPHMLTEISEGGGRLYYSFVVQQIS